MAFTERLALPLLAAGQAQKELTHNEALTILDLAVGGAAESASLVSPPASPTAGQSWIVAAGGDGVWEDRDGSIAGWTNNGWRFLEPVAGLRFWIKDRGHAMYFIDGIWVDEPVREDGVYLDGDRVIGLRGEAIESPSGGVFQDAEARTAIGDILDALRAHGLIEP